MTTKAHKDLTGTDLHEPKGASTATVNQVWRSDGAGSGSFQTLVIPTGTFTVTMVDFTSSGTWTKPANLMGVVFHIIGGGGGSNISFGNATSGGTTSIGTKAVVNGGVARNTTGNAAGGSVGTTPSGSKGYAGLTGDIVNNIGTLLTGIADSTGTHLQGGIGNNVQGPYTLAPGPFGLTGGLRGAGSSVSNTVGVNFGLGAAGSGAYMTGWIDASTLGATETITIGAAGSAGSGAGVQGFAGGAGYCLMTQYISV